MKFENTKEMVSPFIWISCSPFIGIGLAEAYMRWGLWGGSICSIALGCGVLTGLGIYWDWKDSKR